MKNPVKAPGFLSKAFLMVKFSFHFSVPLGSRNWMFAGFRTFGFWFLEGWLDLGFWKDDWSLVFLL